MGGVVVPRDTFEAGLPDPYPTGTGSRVRVAARRRSGARAWVMFEPFPLFWAWQVWSAVPARVPLSASRRAARKRWRTGASVLLGLGVAGLVSAPFEPWLMIPGGVLVAAGLVAWFLGSRYGMWADLTADRRGVRLHGLDEDQARAWRRLADE